MRMTDLKGETILLKTANANAINGKHYAMQQLLRNFTLKCYLVLILFLYIYILRNKIFIACHKNSFIGKSSANLFT